MKWLLFGIFSSASAFAGGSVQGVVTLDAMKPAPARPGYVAPQTKEPVRPPDAAPAIVYLERDDGVYPKTRTGEVLRVRQEDYQFRPSITAVQTGSQALFPNMDDEFHNVFSYSKSKRFDLGRFRKDEGSPAVVFDKAGLVKIYCEIHAHMRCLILVVDTPWFITTDAAGRFTLKNVPQGEYWLRAFLPSEKLLQQRVTVTEGKTVVMNLSR